MRKLQSENGFYFYTFPRLKGEAKSLIVILHGHASHPNKYIRHVKFTQAVNPEADVLLVRAPIALQATAEHKKERRLEKVDDLYTWYDIEKDPVNQVSVLIRNAFNLLTVVERLNHFLDEQLKQRQLKDKHLAFMGFSMGGIVAVQAALNRKKKCAAVVCHSGLVLPLTSAKQKPDTLVIMGDKDEIFSELHKKPQKKLSKLIKAFNKAGIKLDISHKKSVERLQKLGVPTAEKVYPDLKHTMSARSWLDASEFVARKLA